MSSKVIVLGAKGRFGRAATQAFSSAGWQVSAFGRNWKSAPAKDVHQISGDAFDADALTAACTGHDLIINALNPPYPDWTKALPPLTANVIQAARASGATVMIPGNVYNYGANMPAVLCENTPHAPTGRKGRLREDMERQFAGAKDIQTIILRGGDFIEAEQTGNWFDGQIANKVAKGSVMYPGPQDLDHAWAYLPDMARAMVGLAEVRSSLAGFETFGFPGYTLTGAQLITAIEQAAGRTLKQRSMPWFALKMIGIVSPLMREVYEMRYLWNVAHGVDGSKLLKTLPDWAPTPLSDCMRDAIHL